MLLSTRKLKYRFGHYNNPPKSRRLFSSTKRSRAPVLSIFLVLVIILLGFSIVEARIKPTLTVLAEAYVKNLATRAINNAIIEKLAEEDITYASLVDITKNSQGNVTSISTDVVKFNKLKSDVTLATLNALESLQSLKIGIPAGNLYSNQIFAGRGPLIPIKLLPVGSVDIEVKNSFISCGINQTKHEIFLEVKSYLSAVLPTYSIKSAAVTQIPIASTVIVGSVPENYTSISGSERAAADNAISIK